MWHTVLPFLRTHLKSKHVSGNVTESGFLFSSILPSRFCTFKNCLGNV